MHFSALRRGAASKRAFTIAFLGVALSAAGCDSGNDADAGVDASASDAGVDGGSTMLDAGTDAGTSDAGSTDAGMIDGGGTPVSPLFGDIVINEVLTDGTTEGDPNGDGDASPVEDQFVELVNVSGGAIPMGGFTIVEADFPDLPRHTFAAGFSLEADHAVVVFGGGDAPEETATTTFFTANAADPGIPFGLHLSEPADHLLLLDDTGAIVAELCYGGTGSCALAAPSDQSLTRSPDLTGSFVPHGGATGSGGAVFSVGTHADGTPF
jgi:hypothetical protein